MIGFLSLAWANYEYSVHFYEFLGIRQALLFHVVAVTTAGRGNGKFACNPRPLKMTQYSTVLATTLIGKSASKFSWTKTDMIVDCKKDLKEKDNYHLIQLNRKSQALQ